MSALEDAIAFCTRVAPDFARRLRGSSEVDIAALNARRPVDPEHAEFLRAMGEVPPELGLGPMVFSAKQLSEAYRTTSGRLRPDLALIGIARDDPLLDAVLVRGTGGESTVALVSSCVGRSFDELNTFDMRDAEPIAGGLADLLCSTTMEFARGGGQWPFVRYGSEQHGTEDSMSRLLASLRQARFREEWPSNHLTKWLVRDALKVMARQAPGRALQVTLFSSDPAVEEEVIDAIATPLGLVFAPVEAATLREAHRVRALALLATEPAAPETPHDESARLQEGLNQMTLARAVDLKAAPVRSARSVKFEEAEKMIAATRLFLSGSLAPVQTRLGELQSHLHAARQAPREMQRATAPPQQWATLFQAARDADVDHERGPRDR